MESVFMLLWAFLLKAVGKACIDHTPNSPFQQWIGEFFMCGAIFALVAVAFP